jgi:hypothetical protein
VTTWLIITGALVGLGITLIVREVFPSHIELGSALARLQTNPLPSGDQRPAPEHRSSTAEHRLGHHLRHLADHSGLKLPHAELELTRQSVESFLLAKLAMALLGLLAPPLLVLITAMIGLRLPIVVPVGASLALAVLLFLLPDVDVRRKAADARAEFRRGICTFIDLVALERLADAGAIEALERAAAIGDGWVFGRIRDVLVRAQLAGVPAWEGLNALAAEVGVSELGDVGDIVALAGEDGAAVYQTLRARAHALRTAILSQHETDANTASEKLAIPVACLGLAFIALLVYPAIARILTSV